MKEDIMMEEKTPEKIERYEMIRKQVEEDLVNYHVYISNMHSLQDRLFKIKAEYEIPENDIIEAISYTTGVVDTNVEHLGPDKTALAAINYESLQKKMRDEIYRSLYIEYKALQYKIWFIDHCITALPTDQFEIINCLIINHWTYMATAAEMACGKKKISNLKKAAIQSLVAIYEKYYPDYAQMA